MTTFFQCIDNAVADKVLKRADGEKLKSDYRRFRDGHASTGAGAADARAWADLMAEQAAQAAHKRRKAKLSLDTARRIDAEARSHRDAKGKPNIGAAFLDMLEHFGTAKFSSVAGRQRAILGMAHGKMESLLFHFRRGALGGDLSRHHAADLKNVLREAFGTDTGDATARGLANAWMETAEWLRQRFNAAGGAIGRLDNWGLPQHHDPRALRNKGQAAWKNFIRPLLDPAKMRHPLTGRAIDEAELDSVLSDVWETIATEGWIDRKPSPQATGRGALANQRAEHRFLVFKDPDAWLDYQEAFGGGGDIFSAMMGHINMMSRDIAAMEILGPNPGGTVEWMKQTLEKEAQGIAAGKPGALGGADAKKALDRAQGYAKRLDEVWGSIRGSLETPVNGRWANGLAAARSLITSSVLGSAAISSISDVGTSIIARRFVGLSSRGAFGDIVKSFGQGTRREAVQAGLILDNAMHTFHAQARYVGTLNGPGWASFIADRVLTVSGLTPWTQAGRHAFGLAFQAELGNHAGKALADLPEALGRTLNRWGFSGKQWDMMRRMPLHNGLLRPAEIAAQADEKLALRYLEMIQAETEFAIPNGSHRSRSIYLSENRPGTLIGEVIRSGAQFKSFGVSMVFLHGMRIHNMIAGGERAAGAAYAGSLLISTALFGAVALQLKQVVPGGREPRDPTTPEFWGAAMLQGGGLGIYGDFLFADINRFGGGFATTLGGPLINRAQDFWNLTAGNAVQLASGEKTHFGRELVKFARGNIPGGTIWYLRLPFERTVLDQLQYLADPEANKAFKRQQQFWRREFGQEYWWKPGRMAPG